MLDQRQTSAAIEVFTPDAFVQALLKSRAMRRMDKITQLDLLSTSLKAPHTRADHMLDAVTTARNAVAHLQSAMNQQLPFSFDPRMATAVIVACCLHDIGHPPLGHGFERAVERMGDHKFHHEDWTVRLIKEDVELKQLFKSFVRENPQYGQSFKKSYGRSFQQIVTDLIKGKASPSLAAYQSLVAGKIDCDRGAFLPRDRQEATHGIGLTFETSLPTNPWDGIEVQKIGNVPVIVYDTEKAEQFMLAWREQYEKMYYQDPAAKVMLAPVLAEFRKQAQETCARPGSNRLLSMEEKAFYNLVCGKASVTDYLTLNDEVVTRIIDKVVRNPATEEWVRRLAVGLLEQNSLASINLPLHPGKAEMRELENYLKQHMPDDLEFGKNVFLMPAKARDIAKLPKTYDQARFDQHFNMVFVRDHNGEVRPLQQVSETIRNTPPLEFIHIIAEQPILENPAFKTLIHRFFETKGVQLPEATLSTRTKNEGCKVVPFAL